MKKIFKKFFYWIFKEEIEKELERLREQTLKLNETILNVERTSKNLQKKHVKLDEIFENLEVSIDHHQYSNSWAAISLQGNKRNFIKFIQLGDADIRTISDFLSKFDRSKIDASPNVTKHLIRF